MVEIVVIIIPTTERDRESHRERATERLKECLSPAGRGRGTALSVVTCVDVYDSREGEDHCGEHEGEGGKEDAACDKVETPADVVVGKHSVSQRTNVLVEDDLGGRLVPPRIGVLDQKDNKRKSPCVERKHSSVILERRECQNRTHWIHNNAEERG